MTVIHMKPEEVRAAGWHLKRLATDTYAYIDDVAAAWSRLEPVWSGGSKEWFEREIRRNIANIWDALQEMDDLGGSALCEAEQWEEMDQQGRARFAAVVGRSITVVHPPPPYTSDAPLIHFRHPPANRNAQRVEGLCLAYVREFRGDDTFPKHVGNAFELISDPDFSNMRLMLSPGTSDLRKVLEPGFLAVYDRGQLGADPQHGHVAIITQVFADHVIVQETPWGDYRGAERSIPLRDLEQLRFIGYPPDT